jgi:hypothetical protein
VRRVDGDDTGQRSGKQGNESRGTEKREAEGRPGLLLRWVTELRIEILESVLKGLTGSWWEENT